MGIILEKENTPRRCRFGVFNLAKSTDVLFAALYGKEAVAWVFVYFHTTWKVGSFWALVLAEVVDSLLFATA
jgi:hypothetical protein